MGFPQYLQLSYLAWILASHKKSQTVSMQRSEQATTKVPEIPLEADTIPLSINLADHILSRTMKLQLHLYQLLQRMMNDKVASQQLRLLLL